MIATLWIVSRDSASCRPHHASVLVMLVVSTARCASEMGKSFSRLVKERTAKVLGMLSTSHGWLVVVGRVNKLAGLKAGGAGALELCMSARWMGVAAGLELDWPGLGGVVPSVLSSPARWRSSASWLQSWVISCWESGSVALAGNQLWICSAICCAAYLVLAVLSNNFPSCLARRWETLSRDAAVSKLSEKFHREHHRSNAPLSGSGKFHDHEPVSEANGCWPSDTLGQPPAMTEDHILQCQAFAWRLTDEWLWEKWARWSSACRSDPGLLANVDWDQSHKSWWLRSCLSWVVDQNVNCWSSVVATEESMSRVSKVGLVDTVVSVDTDEVWVWQSGWWRSIGWSWWKRLRWCATVR